MSDKIELTHEKSTEQAQYLELVKNIALGSLDYQYLKQAAKGMNDLAQNQKAMMVFVPNYPMQKIVALEAKARALQGLCTFVELMHISMQKDEEAAIQVSNRDEISRIFGMQ